MRRQAHHLFGSLAFAVGRATRHDARRRRRGLRADARAGQDAFAGHGWRYPFLLSAFLGWGGYDDAELRRGVADACIIVEGPAEEDATTTDRGGASSSSSRPARCGGRDEAVDAVDAVALGAEGRRARGGLHPVARGLLRVFVFAPAFYPLPQATLLATRCLLLSVLAMPLAGAASTRGARRTATASRPTSRRQQRLPWALPRRRSSRASLRKTRTPPRWAWTVAAFVHSAFNAALAGWLVRAFDPRARGAVLGLAWNVAAALVGGTAPAFAVLLIE